MVTIVLCDRERKELLRLTTAGDLVIGAERGTALLGKRSDFNVRDSAGGEGGPMVKSISDSIAASLLETAGGDATGAEDDLG